MEQDLRDLFKKHRDKEHFTLKNGHEERFLGKVEKALPQKKAKKAYWISIAATLLMLFSAGVFFFNTGIYTIPETTVVDHASKQGKVKAFSFGDLSPDLKKVEDYYVSNINLELSKLEISKVNKSLIDSYMGQLANLNLEYKDLNIELNQLGPNDQTIAALIENLQLRLRLLQKLKRKLNELKTSKNEQINKNSI